MKDDGKQIERIEQIKQMKLTDCHGRSEVLECLKTVCTDFWNDRLASSHLH